MSELYNGTPPPAAPKVRLDIVRVTSAESHHFICYSRAVWGQPVHWYGRRTHECTQDREKKCEGCMKGWPVKWKGYLHVRNIAASWEGFLELTDTACRLLVEQLGDNQNLRGLKFRIARTKGGAKGRYLVEVSQGRVPDDSLKQERDPYEILKFLWNCKKPSGQMT
jgi:hypothetical protein